jgi:hypothetical protein
MPFAKSHEDAVARGCVTTEATAPRIASHGVIEPVRVSRRIVRPKRAPV